jgi:hypothetical protein
MSLLSNNTVEKLRNQSDNILDVFTSTINDLQAVNSNVDNAMATKLDQRSKIEGDINILQDIKQKNASVIEKIGKILN